MTPRVYRIEAEAAGHQEASTFLLYVILARGAAKAAV